MIDLILYAYSFYNFYGTTEEVHKMSSTESL